MPRKCPPGVICVENFTGFFIAAIIIIGGIVLFSNIKQSTVHEDTINVDVGIAPENRMGMNLMPNYPYTNFPRDVLSNPHVPPLKDERYLVGESSYIPPNTIPINVSTNIGAVNTTYRQVGMLTPLNETSKDNILALMGRPLFTNRNKWQYYTISNQHNNVKLPISVKGKGGLTDYGVDQLYSADTVYVEGYNDAFKATLYENDTIKYMPFL